MHTEIAIAQLDAAHSERARALLGQCVHCGFCNATCPTYQLRGDELDGPRGRIYQIKTLLEGESSANGVSIRQHLDRCLSCRNCEVTCPSGVRYHELLEIGQSALEARFPRPRFARWRRRMIVRAVGDARAFAMLLGLARRVRALLPREFAQRVPDSPSTQLTWTPARHQRRMIALGGCVQPSLAPNTNAAAAQVLDRCGISLREVGGCCGAVALHSGGDAASIAHGKRMARALIDRLVRHLDRGVEGFVMTASGCGLTVREYPNLFEDDAKYRARAQRIGERTLDLCEVIARELPRDYAPSSRRKVAFHAPCTLQHGQRIEGVIESILARVGHEVCAIKDDDARKCCGSAGAYSIHQPQIAAQLRAAKHAALGAAGAEVVCTANVGCQAHLSIGARAPVVHWIELLL